jgi:hypothetical protein
MPALSDKAQEKASLGKSIGESGIGAVQLGVGELLLAGTLAGERSPTSRATLLPIEQRAARKAPTAHVASKVGTGQTLACLDDLLAFLCGDAGFYAGADQPSRAR